MTSFDLRHGIWCLALSLSLSACGGAEDDADADASGDADAADTDGGPPDELTDLRCAIPLTLSGAVTLEVPREDLGCAFPSNGDEDASLMFIPNGGQLSSLTVDIDGVKRDETGEFPGVLTLRFGNGREYRADSCTFTVTHQEAGVADQFGRRYLIRGFASCAEPATSDESSETLTVSDFSFVGGTLWP